MSPTSYNNQVSAIELNGIKLELDNMKKNADAMFLIIMGIFVFCLQAGFAFYESGVVRNKNCTSVLFRNYFDTCLSTLAYFATGYGLSFGDGNVFCGHEYFALIGLPEDKFAHCFFQYTFVACSTTIVKGTVHERCTMTAYFAYTVLIAGFTYPVAAHWALYDKGWLFQWGFNDYAGSGVVHSLAGAASLAATYMCGPRLGKFNKDDTSNPVPAQSIGQVALGSFVFLLGMVAFNAGSQGSISKPGDQEAIAKVLINTMVCVTASTMTSLLFRRFVLTRVKSGWDFDHGANGSFVGMVVVCAGVNQYRPWGSFIVGVISYFFYLVIAKSLTLLKIDDPVGGIGVQIAGGYFGLVGVALFREGGLALSSSSETAYALLVNAVGGLVVIFWAFGNVWLLYVVLRHLDLHRSSSFEEEMGLDMTVHQQPAYHWEPVLKPKTIDVVPANTSTSSSLVHQLTRRSLRTRVGPAEGRW